MLQQTTALRKIASLKKRIWVIQGGQGAGKTFSILILIANYAQANPNKEIFIASQELTKMRITVIKDFINVMKLVGIYDPDRFTSGTFYRFPNGSFIKFIGLDKEDLGKGLRSDLVYVNEANKITFEAYRELTSRAQRVILDFNPNNQFWAHDEVLTREDAQHLILTYNDNEFLSQQERYEIELNKIRAFHDPNMEPYDFPANIKSKYWRNKWNVYGLGVVGSNPNRIFDWDQCEDKFFQELEAKSYFASDWGVVDPWAVLEAKYSDGRLYLNEKNYESENEIKSRLTTTELGQVNATEEGLVRWKFDRLGIPKNAMILCDNNRPSKVMALRQAGYDYAITASKVEIIEGINLLEKLKVYYTKSSKNIQYEQENYCRKVDRYGIVLEEAEDINNHLIDDARYIALFLRAQGIIKVI